MVYDWFEMANECLGMVSNIMFIMFGKSYFSTQFETLDHLFIAEILFYEIQETPTRFAFWIYDF